MSDNGNLEAAIAALHAARPTIARTVFARAERGRSRASSGEGLTIPQHLTLHALAEGALTVSAVADRTGVAISTATRMIQGLERGGLVRRAAVTDGDRRRRHVELTSEGERFLREADDDLRQRLRMLLGLMTPEDRAALLQGVAVLTAALASLEAAHGLHIP